MSAMQAQSLPPVEAFGNLPVTSEPRLSPDGKHFAVIQPVKGRPAAVIYDSALPPGVIPAVVTSGESLIADLLWAKNDRLIVIAKQAIARKTDEDGLVHTWTRALSVDLAGQNLVTLMKNVPAMSFNANGSAILDVDLDDPDTILMGLWEVRQQGREDLDTNIKREVAQDFKYDIFKVDVRTGKGHALMSGDSTTLLWMSDGHGNPVARINQTEHPLKDHLFVDHHGSWSEVGVFDASGDNGAGLVGLTEDGNAVVLNQWNTQSFAGLVRHDLTTGAETPLFFLPDRDVASAISDEWTGRTIGAQYIGEQRQSRYFDDQRQSLQNGLEKAFPGQSVRIVSWDRSATHVTFGVEGPRQPELFYLLDRTTHQTSLITVTYPGLKESDLGEMRAYDYKARDGLAIPAYLTLPPGKAPKNLPVVVLAHGGPDARDFRRFDWMAQFLANRGYVVLQPNFRGSSGYGHRFTEAGLQQWGLKIQDDVTDGVRKLIADGIADPKRICIVGGSFGGYVALAGATFTPDVYACAASWAGISDIPVMLHAEVKQAGADSAVLSFWKSRIGSGDMAALAATSPARNAARVKCPVLLLHGEGDTTVRIDQSEIEEQALHAAGKRVSFVRFTGGEDHYMNVAATRIRVLSELEKFLKANIGD